MKDIKNFILESSQDLDDLEEMTQDLSEWWDNDFCNDEPDSKAEYIKDMKNIANGETIDVIWDIAKSYLVDDREYSERKVNRLQKDLIHVLQQWAKDEIKDPRW